MAKTGTELITNMLNALAQEVKALTQKVDEIRVAQDKDTKKHENILTEVVAKINTVAEELTKNQLHTVELFNSMPKSAPKGKKETKTETAPVQTGTPVSGTPVSGTN